MKKVSLLVASLACSTAWPAYAQEAQAGDHPPQQSEDDNAPIIVRGARLPGAVIGDIAPEVTLTPGDIRSFGVSSISDLLAELAPQTTSGQGRGGESPVVLLNGKRVSSFAEVRDIPVEAIQRAEILPEEVALKYGYPANQKVVNFVLRRRFHAITGELEDALATEGGRSSPEAQGSLFKITPAGRLNVALSYVHSSPLYESERDISGQPGSVTVSGNPSTVFGLPSVAATRAPTLTDFASGPFDTTDQRASRTLLAKTNMVKANAVLARTIFGNVSATFNATLTYDESDSEQGLQRAQFTLPTGSPYSPFATDASITRYLTEIGALGQQSHDLTGHLGTSMNGQLGKWNWSMTAGYDHGISVTNTDVGYANSQIGAFQDRLDALDPLANPFAPLTGLTTGPNNWARSTSGVGTVDMVLTGSPFSLPAGQVTTTLKIGGGFNDFDSRAFRSGTPTQTNFSRNDVDGQASIDLPIASRKKDFLSPLGELSANFNVAYDQLSDFGGLRTIGAGINWKPVTPIALIVSISKDEGAPTVQQLGNPLVLTTGVRVFDYVQGETVDITRRSAGNPNLRSDDRRIFKAGLTIKPMAKTDLSLTINYTNSRVNDPIATFPTATAAIEAAFPQRFTRDVNGRLTEIDSSPVNFLRQNKEEIRWGINFSKQLSTPPRPAGGARGQGGGDGQTPSLRDLLPAGQNGQQTGQGQNGQTSAAETRSVNGGGVGSGGQGVGGPGGGGFGGGPGGGGFGRGGGGRGTRLQLALYHTIHLREQIVIANGVPTLDLLNGDVIGSSGGQSRHEIQGQAGLTHNGLGIRLSANWQSATNVNGGTRATDTLHFSDLTTVNLRLFANLGQIPAAVKKVPFLRGSRFSLSVTNLFNNRLRVTDGTGITPISYQPDYLDPLGRSVQISFRKLFF